VVQMSVPPAKWKSRSRVKKLDPDRFVFEHTSQTDDGNPSYITRRWKVGPDPAGASVEWACYPQDVLPAVALGQERQLAPLDERLAEIGIKNPEEADQAMVAVLGPKTATGAWHDHFRVWRKRRLRQLERQYGDRLDEVADFLADFAAQIKAVGPKTYLESVAYNDRDAKRDKQKELDRLSPDRRS
jgi:hypothetical protein